ncbi:Golgi to ER traffic protein [Ananas comosus]|uniref:Golgi to ER traffic protein n=1 Tax=Ananas comosus TaxID=4615 RepID=A0A199ULV7_ANACO|nr:Golgi to ER traffic protein [Ananas comosus]
MLLHYAPSDSIGKIYEAFPRISVPQHLEDDDDDMQKLSEALVAAKVRVESCSSFLKAAINAILGEDIAITRAVLLYLSQGNLRDANILIDEIKRQLESKQLEFPRSDLTKFIDYLLQTLERDAFPLFKILREKYRSSIERESLFGELLDEIAERFYGVRRRSGLQGIFGDLFKMV